MRSTTVGTFERWGGEEWGGECTALEILTVGSDGSHRHRFGKSIFKLYSFVASAQVEWRDLTARCTYHGGSCHPSVECGFGGGKSNYSGNARESFALEKAASL